MSVFKLENEPTPKIQIATAELNNKTLQIVGEKTWYNANFFEWFNDGTGIVFIGKANLSETMQIWHLSFPSGELRQISSDTSDYASLSVSADGNTIVATKVDVISSIWSFLPNTKELRQLTGESRTLVGGRGISQTPDGKILYSKKTGKEINIFAMDENGGNEKQLTAENGFNFEPISTSDNRFIVFSSNRDNAYSVWKMNTDGSNAVRLTKPENAMDGQLQVTGDSRNVVFARQKSDGGKSNLMKVSIDGGKAEPLLPESKSSDLFSQISPDGNQLAYHTFEVDGGISNFKSSVKIVGLNKMNIEKSSKEIELSLDHNFKWSPGGNSLTYINKLGTDNLWSVSLDDKKEKQITEFNSGNITNFAWSRNGKKLFIVRGIVNSDLILIKDTGKFS
ncbi:MAG: hypothetical protein LC778_16225 [Acidobacteria bacterium]|nr:hypothetical protein [Acidobacteriota bacterium]